MKPNLLLIVWLINIGTLTSLRLAQKLIAEWKRA